MNTQTPKLYSDMTPADRARIDAEEDRREARKANFVGADLSMDDLFRNIYAQRRNKAREIGFTGNFAHACITANGGGVPATPEQWVTASETALAGISRTLLGYDITNICH